MKRWVSGTEYIERLAGALAAANAAPGDETYKRIVDWLAELRLLHGVPFQYLIPDERILPPESIRFFQIDENWITCLIDGAFSIGRSTTGDVSRDAQHVEQIASRIARSTPTLRARRLGGPVAEENEAPPGFSASGFLLRSGVVSGWPGLEVRGYEEDGSVEVKKVRFERVAGDILFCLFERRVTRVVFSEPAEILHFGLQIPDGPDKPYAKTLKWVKSGGSEHPAGTEMKGVHVTAPLLEKRVLDVSALANSIHAALIENGGIDKGAPYTTAEFALEMVQGVQEVIFQMGAGGMR